MNGEDAGKGIAAPARAARLDPAGRRERLRQYQQQLLERMQLARSSGGARLNQLGVMIGSRRYLLDLSHTGEIVPLTALCPVPLAQPWYLGLSSIRGNLVGIIDYARYLGHGDTAQAQDSRVITFAPGLGFNCGLLATRVLGLRHAADMQQDGECLRDADNNEWAPLDLAALVRDPRFLHVGATL